MPEKPINPFEAAMNRTCVTAELRIEDVLGLRPEWSEARAKTLIDCHAAFIASAMLSAGIAVLEHLLEQES